MLAVVVAIVGGRIMSISLTDLMSRAIVLGLLV
jgi:hypothetical protein